MGGAGSVGDAVIPLPFVVQHRAFLAGVEDEHGNIAEGWADPVPVRAAYWSVSSSEPQVAGHDRVIVDAAMFVSADTTIGARDRVEIVDLGGVFEVVGLPERYDYGPFEYRPGRCQVNLRRVEG